MCVAAFAWNPRLEEPLLLAANRDEFRARPAAPLSGWAEGGIVGGRDLAAGGTWLAMRRHPNRRTLRFGFLTNIRDPSQRRGQAPSRGHLVPDFLLGTLPPLEHLGRLAEACRNYEGFNLLVGEIGPDGATLGFLNSVERTPRALPAGLYGLSNATLDTPWPKLVRLRQALAHARAERDPARQKPRLWRILTDRRRAEDAALPRTGIPLAWERDLSAIFIDRPEYGTRASTVMRLDATARASICERTWHANGSYHEVTLRL